MNPMFMRPPPPGMIPPMGMPGMPPGMPGMPPGMIPPPMPPNGSLQGGIAPLMS